MKSIKLLLAFVFISLSIQTNAQKILEKWEDLNNVNQIFTKVSYIASERNFETLGKYTTMLNEYTNKLNESFVKELKIENGVNLVNDLKAQAAKLNDVAQKGKGEKSNILTELNLYEEILKKLVSSKLE